MGRVCGPAEHVPSLQSFSSPWAQSLTFIGAVHLDPSAVSALARILLTTRSLRISAHSLAVAAHAQVLRNRLAGRGDLGRPASPTGSWQTPGAQGTRWVSRCSTRWLIAIAYLDRAMLLASVADPRLALWPILVGFGLYLWLVLWTVKRIGPASKASSGRAIDGDGARCDAITNIHSSKCSRITTRAVPMPKRGDRAYPSHIRREMRAVFRSWICVCVPERVYLIVSVVGWAIWLVERRFNSSVGIGASRDCAGTLRLNAMTGWIMCRSAHSFGALGVVSEGMEDDQRADQAGRCTGRQS